MTVCSPRRCTAAVAPATPTAAAPAAPALQIFRFLRLAHLLHLTRLLLVDERPDLLQEVCANRARIGCARQMLLHEGFDCVHGIQHLLLTFNGRKHLAARRSNRRTQADHTCELHVWSQR